MLNLDSLRNWNFASQPSLFECSLAELEILMDFFADKIEIGDWIFLNGDLGTGKTTFTQLLLKKLGYKEVVSSPTFSIINVLNISDPLCLVSKVCHLDLYRIKKQSELAHLGLELEFSFGAVCIFEWSELIDVEGWSDFFHTTRCRMPNRLIEINISRKNETGERVYGISLKDMKEVFV